MPRAWGVADVRRRWLAVDGVVLATLVVVDVLVWAMTGGGFFWPAITLVLCAVVYAAHAVLADRGLLAAVRALDLPLPVAVEGAIDVPLDPANESAAYFAVAECLTNVIKHSGAGRARVDLATDPPGSAIVVLVSDDGMGGADPRAGSELRGVARRLEAVDGTLDPTAR